MLDEEGFTGLESKVFTKVKVPNRLRGLSPFKEPSVLFVIR